MKQNFTFSYILYFAIAIFIHPVKSTGSQSSENYIKSAKNIEMPLAVETNGILHSELLFKF